METHFDEMEEAENTATVEMVTKAISEAYDRGIDSERLQLTVTRGIYDALTSASGVYSTAHHTFDEFRRLSMDGETIFRFFGVRMKPAEWGTGWTLREKRKGKK